MQNAQRRALRKTAPVGHTEHILDQSKRTSTGQANPSPSEVTADFCLHGGKAYGSIGEDFSRIERSDQVIAADVLDAWYPPSPKVLETLRTHLEWSSRTSPPARCEGLKTAISEARGLPLDSLVLGSGSSDLIFRALPHVLAGEGTVILPSPVYGEYFHVLSRLHGKNVLRFSTEETGFQIDVRSLADFAARHGASAIVLVNPCNPTGQVLTREQLTELLALIPRFTKLLIDETYIDYAPEHSMERSLGSNLNLLILKSMSKVYALSGLRVGYMALDPALARQLDAFTPPYAVSTLAQMAAIAALEDPAYTRMRLEETSLLRAEFSQQLKQIPGLKVWPGAGNFLLITLPESAPGALEMCRSLSEQGIHLRSLDGQGARNPGSLLRVSVLSREKNERVAGAIARFLSSSLRPRIEAPETPSPASF